MSSTPQIEPERALELLADDAGRRILATLDDPMTTQEVADECGIPRSTAYRKIEQLDEAGLVEDAVRLSPDGGHPVTYRRAFEAVDLDIAGDNVQLTVAQPNPTGNQEDGG